MTDTQPARIWIDADACPRDVKELVFRAGERLQLTVMVVANKAMFVPTSLRISMVQVAGGPDVADNHIVRESCRGDLAITADIPLAARLVPKGVVVLNPRGEEYDSENIGERLSVRDFMTEARDAGVVTGGPSAFGPKDKQRFANALDRALYPSQPNAGRPELGGHTWRKKCGMEPAPGLRGNNLPGSANGCGLAWVRVLACWISRQALRVK